MFTKLEPANIIWRGDAPFSTEFQDVYFSPAGGFEETLEVFVAGNGLPQRWQDCAHFTIAETGFGTGLNFLITLQQWALHAPADARLSYISVEKKPLRKDDLTRALQAWPTLGEYAKSLLENYPDLTQGFHRRWFLDGRVSLTLMFTDVVDAFAAMRPACVDAWYLDGFAPSRNPQMWQDSMFAQMAQLSNVGATYSTYTAASAVRRVLQQAGFSVEKKPGFAGKRERIQGRLLNRPHAINQTPWYALPSDGMQTRDAIVIGGGISGAAMAHTLVQRGWQITMLERGAELANEGSGNLAGVVMPRLEAGMGVSGQFFLAAYLHTVKQLDASKVRSNDTLPWFKSGVIELCDVNKRNRLSQYDLPYDVLRAVDANEASELAGVKIAQDGVYYPQAGYIDPVAWVRFLVAEAVVQVRFNWQVARIEYENGYWRVHRDNGEVVSAKHVVLANAFDAMRLVGDDYLALSSVRGQLSYLPTQSLKATVRVPLVAEGYIVPAYQDRYCVGATYHHGDACSQLRMEDHLANLAPLNEWLSNESASQGDMQGRVAWRAMTRDHLPCVGAAPDAAFYRSDYADLKFGRRPSKYAAARYQPGLWLLTGMGSRGLVSAPYCAELLADMMEQRPLNAPLSITHALHPARRIVRALKKGDE